jgi:hypothetical protein
MQRADGAVIGKSPFEGTREEAWIKEIKKGKKRGPFKGLA